MADNIGTAYVQIEPSFEGVTPKIEEAFSGEGEKASKSFGKGFGSVIGVVGKAMAGAAAAGASAAAAITKQAVSSFGEYEQLAGGVEKIFDGMDTSAIINDASNAYKDLGLSANQYLATINDVGATFASTMGAESGYNTAKKGLQAISDYASGTGKNVDLLSEKFTMITRSTSSYQSIADQFSGILPATSAAFLEQAKNSGFLADSYKSLTEVPIEEYQQAVTNMLEKGVAALNLTGNTADEATRTFTGSLAMVQSAWQNTITAIGQGDTAIIEENINRLVESAGAFASNVLPIAQRALQGISQLITQLAPEIAAALPDLIAQILPGLLEAGVQIITSLAQGIIQAIPQLMPAITDVILQLCQMLVQMLPQLIEVGLQVILQLALGIAQALPELIPAIVDTVLTIAEYLIDNVDLLIDASIALIIGLAEGLIEALPKLIEKAPEIVTKLGDAIIRNAPKILGAAVSLILTLIEGIVKCWGKVFEIGAQIIEKIKGGFTSKSAESQEWGRDLIDNFINGIKEKWEHLKQTVGQVAESIKSYLGFSEPEEGPLSNFHTYAPDMMELYAKGITENAGLVRDALTDATSGLMNTSVDVSAVRTIQTSNESVSADSGVSMGRVAALLETFVENFKQEIYLDTGVLVGATAPAYNTALGQIAVRGGNR